VKKFNASLQSNKEKESNQKGNGYRKLKVSFTGICHQPDGHQPDGPAMSIGWMGARISKPQHLSPRRKEGKKM